VSLFGLRRHAGAAELPVEGRLPGFEGASGWLNSEPLTLESLRGKVVLVDFWTYTCINWLRTLGYVRAWAQKYADKGLVVVGVHTPEFPFERDADNVRWAVKDMAVEWPVALDPDYEVWRAFANHYWPAVYIADAEGRIRHHQFGEGMYDECERVIQMLLGIEEGLVAPALEGFEVQADWESLASPETYLGSEQAQGYRADAAPDSLRLNQWTLVGDWTIGRSAALSNQPDARLAFRFHARDVNLVMGPRARGESVPFRVLVDGRPPGDDYGVDVEEDGNGEVVQQRLYQLVRRRNGVTDATIEITFLAPGAEAYCFTFG
jgi:thiol-disulfide isomerase/thioredoxin